jgi:hypothetical protein
MPPIHNVIRHLDGQRIAVEISEGRMYEVQPTDPKRSAQTGRLCLIESLDDWVMPRRARVRFEDTGKIGLVDLTDLVEVETV